MRTFLFGLRTCQKHLNLRILRIFILICIISWSSIYVNTGQVGTDPKLYFQDHLALVTSNSRTTPSWPTISAVPTPTPATSTNGNGTSPSGQVMPRGDIPGWHQIFAEDFNTNVTMGNMFSSTVYGSQFKVYPDGTQDTAGKQGAPSRYYPSKVVSVSNGLLNLYLHTENGTPMAATILPVIPGSHLYGKYTIRFRSDALPGFKVAWMLWPDSENWPHDGEIDFPESALNETIGAFVHHQNGTSGSDQDVYNSTATYTSWHTASIEWSPNKVNFLLDDQSIGTSTNRIPATPMHWIVQTESCLPTCPATTTAGNLQIAWMAAYSLA